MKFSISSYAPSYSSCPPQYLHKTQCSVSPGRAWTWLGAGQGDGKSGVESWKVWELMELKSSSPKAHFLDPEEDKCDFSCGYCIYLQAR